MHPRYSLSAAAWSQTPHQRSVRISRPHTLAAYTCPRLLHQAKNPPGSKHRMIAGHGIGLRVARWGRACGLSCGRARSPAPAATRAKILNVRIVVKEKLARAYVFRLAGGSSGRLHRPSTGRSGSYPSSERPTGRREGKPRLRRSCSWRSLSFQPRGQMAGDWERLRASSIHRPCSRHGGLRGNCCGHNDLTGAIRGAAAKAHCVASYLLEDLAWSTVDAPRADGRADPAMAPDGGVPRPVPRGGGS